MRHWAEGPAADRLEWILDGLNGSAGWGDDAAGMLAPRLTAMMPANDFALRIRQASAGLAPITLIGVDLGPDQAKARIRARSGDVFIVSCVVEPEKPHQIISATTTPLVPPFLAPRLPADFTEAEGIAPAPGARLIVFAGLPGTGKSTLADAVGRQLGVPVFGADWLLGALTPFGGRQLDNLLDIGAELLTTIAFRQLMLGQSVILDHPAENPADRTRWQTLAEAAGAEFRAVVCTCSDPDLHRSRLEQRKRGIPGWHEAGNWVNVQQRLAKFPPWDGEALIVDAARPLGENIATVLAAVSD